MKISPAGYVRCPSCLSHVKATAESVDCPFCEHSFVCAESHPVLGGGTDSVLSKSRAGLIALGLVGLTMAVACDDDDPKDPNNTNNETNWEDPQNDYGGFEIEPENNTNNETNNETNWENPQNDYGGFEIEPENNPIIDEDMGADTGDMGEEEDAGVDG